MWFRDFRSFVGIYLVIFPIIFFFSAITYKMRDEVFKKWMKFAIFYVPAYVLLTICMVNNSEGGGWALPTAGLFAAIILFFFLLIFFIISLILIIAKHGLIPF
jgi:hypothetical protein